MQVALDRRDGAEDARVGRRQEADQRQQQQAGVELLRTVGLHEAAALGVEAARQTSSWMSSRMSRQRSSGPGRPNSSALLIARSKATQAITLEWVKCSRPPRTSQMPSSGSLQIVSRCSSNRAAGPSRIRRSPRPPLRAPGAARPSPRHRRRAGTGCAPRCRCAPAASLVARQPRQLEFGQAPLAADAVHDLQLLRAAGDGAQQPVAPLRASS